MLDLSPLPGFAAETISVASDGWQRRSAGSGDYLWHGSGDVPGWFVVLSWAVVGSIFRWRRAERPSQMRWNRLGRLSSPVNPPLKLDIRAGGWSSPYVHRGIGFSLGHAYHYVSASTHLDGQLPTLESPLVVTTGTPTRVLTVEGAPRLEMGLLVLMRRDVRGLRKGLWHVPQKRLASVPMPWRLMLGYGRGGEMPQNVPGPILSPPAGES